MKIWGGDTAQRGGWGGAGTQVVVSARTTEGSKSGGWGGGADLCFGAPRGAKPGPPESRGGSGQGREAEAVGPGEGADCGRRRGEGAAGLGLCVRREGKRQLPGSGVRGGGHSGPSPKTARPGQVQAGGHPEPVSGGAGLAGRCPGPWGGTSLSGVSYYLWAGPLRASWVLSPEPQPHPGCRHLGTQRRLFSENRELAPKRPVK